MKKVIEIFKQYPSITNTFYITNSIGPGGYENPLGALDNPEWFGISKTPPKVPYLKIQIKVT